MATMLPVEGWMAIIELSWCATTAARAAASAVALIVVSRFGMVLGATMTAWLFGTS